MTVSINTAPISPLRQRMQHDMMMRGLGPHTQQDYIRHVKRLAAFLGRLPDTAAEEDLRRFQIHQHENGARPSTISLSQWPCEPRCGQRNGMCPAVSVPTSTFGIIPARAADIPSQHRNARGSANVACHSAPRSRPAKPTESLNPHRPSCRTRGFLHGRLSYASARNPSPYLTFAREF
jgi:hypothetical protein